MAYVEPLCPVESLLNLVRVNGPGRTLHLDHARVERDWMDVLSFLQCGFSVAIADKAIEIRRADGLVIGRRKLNDLPSELLTLVQIIAVWGMSGNGHILEALIGAARGAFQVEPATARQASELARATMYMEAASFLTPSYTEVAEEVLADGIEVKHIVPAAAIN